MLPPAINILRLDDKRHWRELSETELIAAHASAATLADGMRQAERRYWRMQAWSLLVAGSVPLLGHLLLGWPLLLLVLVVMIDNAAVWMGDLIRAARASRAVEVEKRRVASCAATASIALALLSPKRSARHVAGDPGRSKLGHADVVAAEGGADLVRRGVLAGLLVLGPLLMALVVASRQSPEQFWGITMLLLLLPVLLRWFAAWRVSPHAGHRQQPRPELYPQTEIAIAAFVGTLVLYMLLFVAGPALVGLQPLSRPTQAVAALLCYLLVCSAVAIGIVAMMRLQARVLAVFAASDRAALLAQLRRFNGA